MTDAFERAGRHRTDLLGIFANHRVAANLLMSMMLLAGSLALYKLNIQFFPNFELDNISVNTLWSGASAEDVETGITIPLEQRLRNVDNLKEMSSSSAPGLSGINLEFEEGTDIVLALDQVKKQVDDFDSLPQDAEDPEVTQTLRYESVARLLISGPDDLGELRKLARQFEQELLARGIDKIDFDGLPEEAIEISIPSEQLRRLDMSLSQIGERIDRLSQDLPAGLIGENHGTRELRSLNQRREPIAFNDLPIIGGEDRRIDLGAVAEIERRPRQGSQTLSHDGKQAVVLVLQRTEHGDSLESAEILQQWLAERAPTLPPDIQLKVFNERWDLIKQRIMLLVNNGAGGLLLVLGILYLFLSARVAFWVAVGIPVSFMATLAVLYAVGGSINMVSLFALIMALGIIVDDAIVVGEDAQAHFDRGEDPLKAAEGGARRMLAPVMASSLTTVAAFLPLMLIGGHMGNIMFAIPLVIISVILASLVESFLILPGHLRHAFGRGRRGRHSRLRDRLDRAFNRFREGPFRRLVQHAIEFRWTTLTFGIGCLLLAVGLFAGGRLSWQFFPSPDSTTVYANVRFMAGTAQDRVDRFLAHLEQTLKETQAEYDETVVDTAYVSHGASSGRGRAITGERVGSIYVELTAPDSRRVQNNQFIRDWRQRVQVPPGVESFTLAASRSGPHRKDLEIRLTGADPHRLKQAALELEEAIKGVSGVGAIDDDLPYGREQLIYSLTPEGEALGLTILDLGQQLRAAYDGIRLQRFQDGADEVEVRIQLPEQEQRNLTSLEQLPIRLPNGFFTPLGSVAEWRSKLGFEALRHADGRLSVSVTGDVDPAVANTQEILDGLARTTLPQLVSRYGISYSFEGSAASQRDTLTDMRIGVLLALLLIYLVLAWVFASYGWPLLVMAVIPLGLTGAILGHWIMGMNMTLLSLFGFFALSGIVVNDSIIMVTFYKHLRTAGMAVREALVEAACQRLRAVLLTSLTTIAGLTPLLFETSRQAQFLIPMVTSIAFGLGFATLLILLVVPSLLSIYEDAIAWLKQRHEALIDRITQSQTEG
ncbi:MAG: efflux RND transporter permease subunit [Chromatiales bacterium]|jgi:multidrug efflux pump subunit AcrB